MAQIRDPSGTALIGSPETDVLVTWIFILANLVWLWRMACPPTPVQWGAGV